jgi:hypothetical protein
MSIIPRGGSAPILENKPGSVSGLRIRNSSLEIISESPATTGDLGDDSKAGEHKSSEG